MSNYRLVCTAKNTEKVVTHIMGIDQYKFTYDDAVALGEEVNGLDERLQVQIEIECSIHGWTKSLIGECYECQREAADNVAEFDYQELQVTYDPCENCVDPHGCPCIAKRRMQAKTADVEPDGIEELVKAGWGVVGVILDEDDPRYQDPFQRPGWNGDPNEY